jgi:Xaa-Pro dipeptidase
MDPRHAPAVPLEEYGARLSGLRRRMAAREVETLVVFTPENVCYLTGYETIGYASFQALIVRRDAQLLYVREMERTVAEATTCVEAFATYGDTDDPVEGLLGLLRRRAWASGRSAVETQTWFVGPAAMVRLRQGLGDPMEGSGLVEAGRRVKSPSEIGLIRRACRVTEAGMAAALKAVRSGATENAAAKAAYGGMMDAGSDFMAGDPIVTSGWRSGVAHTTFANRTIEPGDAVLIELGGCCRRYFGPLMRSAAVPPVSGKIRRMSETIVAALDAAIAAIRPGVTSGSVDAACREVLEQAGYEPYFRKRTGYSVGVAFAPDWGEGHITSLRRDDPTVLEPGMVFHIPPALRVPGEYGVGFSETVLVTGSGSEVLTNFPRELYVP